MEEKKGEHVFHCRSPIFMCPQCARAESCRDLLYLLEVFRLEDARRREEEDDFPFLARRKPGREPDPRNRFNDLTSGEWLRFTRTVFPSRLPKNLAHNLRRRHPDYKSPYLMGQLIAFFTMPGDLVLDPFAGTGAALAAAAILGRESIGFEINQEWIQLYNTLCTAEGIEKHKIVHGDCRHLIRHIPDDSVDFVILDPPHPGKEREWFTAAGDDGRRAVEAFADLAGQILPPCRRVLKPGKHLAMFTRNLFMDGGYIQTAPMLAQRAETAGFVLRGEKIWENPAEKLRPYGYPHTYVPNIVHYNVLLFQKRTEDKKKTRSGPPSGKPAR
ncbi:MAG: DNA methyltransferase [bacterium]